MVIFGLFGVISSRGHDQTAPVGFIGIIILTWVLTKILVEAGASAEIIHKMIVAWKNK
jgi:hypothetical protein